MKLTRYDKNPIISPTPGSDWADFCTCNPAAWYDGEKVHLLYRAAPKSDEHPIYFGYATSTDGYTFESESDGPVFGPAPGHFDGGCVEDPRIIKFGDTYFVTYAARMFYPGAYWTGMALNHYNPPMPPEAPMAARENLTRTGLAATKDFKTWHRLGPITAADIDNRDVIIFPEKINGEFYMMHRPATWCGEGYPCDKPSIWLSFSPDMLTWKNNQLLAESTFDWECKKIGGGTPPLRTDEGWLTLYHGVDENSVYRVGALILDLNDPSKIIARSSEPVLEPVEEYETTGIFPNVVFPCGNVVIDDTLLVYYGGADKYTCIATAPFMEFVSSIMQG